MRLNQPSERSAIRFLPDVPVVNPCELPHTRQQVVDEFLRRLRFFRGVSAHWRDFQLAIGKGGIRQSPCLGQLRDERQIALQQSTAPCKVAYEHWINGNW